MPVQDKHAFSSAELEGRWNTFFEESDLRRKVIQVAEKFPEERSLVVKFVDIDSHDSELADHLLNYPEPTLEAGEKAIQELLPSIMVSPEPIRLRIEGIPPSHRVPIRLLREKHLNRFLAVDGIVRRMTEVRPQIVEAVFECAACRGRVSVPQEIGAPTFKEATKCDSCGKPLGKTRFTLLPEASRYIDSQKIEVQENPEKLKGGAHPEGLTVILSEDLVGHTVPGHRIVVNGRLKSLPHPGGSKGYGNQSVFDLVLLANSMEKEDREYQEIEITEEDKRAIEAMRGEKDFINKFVDSLAPSIQGMRIEKEAIALQLFGGVAKEQPDGIRVRGDIHLLLVGDPGCLIGDERVALGDGTAVRLESMGSRHLEDIHKQIRLGSGGCGRGWATRFHRYENQPILEVVTDSGKSIKGTFNHPLLTRKRGLRLGSEWKRLDQLKVGDHLCVAQAIQCKKTSLVPTGWTEPNYYHRSWHVRTPECFDEDLAAILGYVLGDGWVTDRRIGFMVAPGEAEVAPRLCQYFQKVFNVQPRPLTRNNLVYYDVSRTCIAQWFSFLREGRVPEVIFQSRNSVVASFLRWLYEADGSCFARGRGRTSISLRSAKLELLRDVQNLLLRWGIYSDIVWSGPPKPHLKDGKMIHGGPSGSLMIRRSRSMLKFAREIGFESQKKRSRLKEVVSYASVPRQHLRHDQRVERVVSVLPAGYATVYDIEVPGPQRFLANGVISHNTAKSQLLRYVAEIAPRGIYTSGKGATAAGLTAAAVKDDFGGGRWTLEAGAMVLADQGHLMIDELDKMTENDRSSMHEALEQQSYHPDFEIMLANGEKQPIGSLVDGLLKANISRVLPGKNCEILPLEGLSKLQVLTTDLKEVTPCAVDRVSRHTAPNRFVRITFGNGCVITVTPEHPIFVWKRGRIQTVSAEKISSGEQAPVVRPHRRDENLETPSPHSNGGEIPGGEAGPILLTKIQKVESIPNDGVKWVYDVTVEPHHTFVSEGLVLHNTVSVAKAGITSTLRARCPVLAAANPKLGRFTMDKLPVEEIDLPPTLLSRFDVIFAIQDKADREKDRTLAGAILARQVQAEEREAHKARSGTEPEEQKTPTNLFTPEFMRKYIAYAKQNVSPVMEEAAHKALLDFYVNLRKLGEGEHKPVPITMRQVEGLVRLTEASARARLSPLATKEDAERAIRIVEHFLRTVIASEGSALDIDYITVGVSTSFRNEISTMREIMRKLQQGTPDGFTVDDVLAEAKKKDIKEDKALRLISELERLNEVFKPRIGLMKLL
jgi:DNA replicative helicase MCM subunit Mcm2 (Cdc46/Mcm family)